MKVWFRSFFQLGLAIVSLAPVLLLGQIAPPELDMNRVINESYNFLKNREPDMTATEHALYVKIIPMVSENPEFALTLLENMMSDDESESAAFKFALGNVYMNSGRSVDGERYYRAAVEQYPDFLRAWMNLGIHFYSEDNFEEAVTCLTKSVELGNREAQTYGLLGYCLNQEGNPIAAEASYMQALTIAPAAHEWVEALLSLYLDTDQFVRSEAMLKQLLRLQPTKTESWQLYASVLTSQGREGEAIAVLDAALSLGVIGSEGTLLLGDLCFERSLYAEAVEAYGRVLNVSPALGTNRLLSVVTALIDEEQLDKAKEVLGSIDLLSLNTEEEIRYLQAAATLAVAQGSYGEAEDRFLQALDLDPLNGELLIQLANFYQGNGQFEKSAFAFEQALLDQSTAYRARLGLVKYNMDRRDFQRAANHLEAALRIEYSALLSEYLARIRTLDKTK